MDYPATVAEVLEPDGLRYRCGVIEAVKRFRIAGPWRGKRSAREAKFLALHQALCEIYGVRARLVIGPLDGGSSGRSFYRPARSVSASVYGAVAGGAIGSRLPGEIVLIGKLSVVTYLHEFAHALGKGERGACRWSLNLFRQVFPDKFAKLNADGHMLRVAPREGGVS